MLLLLTSARLSRIWLGLWLLLCRRRLLLLAAGLRGLLLEQCAGRWRLTSFQTTTGSVYHFLGEYCWTVQQLLLLLWRGH